MNRTLGICPGGVQFQGDEDVTSNSFFKCIMRMLNPTHLGSEMHICGVIIPPGHTTIVDDINGKRKACRHWKAQVVEHKHAHCEGMGSILAREFPGVLTHRLGRVKSYVALRMRFSGQVPSDGRKRFLGSQTHHSEAIEEWLTLGVIQSVRKQSASVSQLLLIPNENKSRFRLSDDLRTLNTATVKEWVQEKTYT